MDTRTSRNRKTRRLAFSVILCGFLAFAPAAAFAEQSGGMSKNAGIGVGSALASLVYAPVKLCYAVGGLVVGGLAWAFSGGDSRATMVLTPSLRGDYVITKEQLLGKHEIEFFGRQPEYRDDDGWDDMPISEEVASASPSRW